MPEKPVDKKKKPPTSIWEISNEFDRLSNMVSSPVFTPLRELGLDGYTHWPSPYNFQRQIKIKACQDGWIAEIELYANVAAYYFWTNLLPSPVEITRKLFLGQYKCGFYLPIRFKSPLQFIIGKGGVKALAWIARPFTRVLFWWWVASSIFAAFDTYQMVVEAKEDCPTDFDEVICENADRIFNGNGSIAAWTWASESDPGNHSPPSSSAASFYSGPISASFAVQVEPRGMTSGSWWLSIGDGLGHFYAEGDHHDWNDDNQEDYITAESTIVDPAQIVCYFNILNVNWAGTVPICHARIFTARGPKNP